MEQQTKSAVPRWYWVIAVVALLWSLMNCGVFGIDLFAQESFLESWTEPQKAWARSIPGWIYFVFGLAVATGLVGSIGLLLRKRWAAIMFTICVVAVIVQQVYSMFILAGLQVMGPSGLIPSAVVIIIPAALLLFSRFAGSRGWLT